MGDFLKLEACPACPSSDGFGLFKEPDGRISGWCFVCGHFVYNKNLEEIVGGEESGMNNNLSQQRDINWVLEHSSEKGIASRNIREDIATYFGVRAGVNPSTGEEAYHYYPVFRDGSLVGYKERNVKEKKFTSIGNCKSPDLFGANKVGQGGKLLIITEGELDVLAATQLLKDRGKNYRVVGLPNGANSKSIKENIEWIESFENVFLSLDQDEPGQKAAKEIADLITPGKCKIMHFSEKDPCDMLLADKGAEFFNSVYTAHIYRPDGIVSVDDVLEDALRPVEWGLSWPWESLTQATYGYRRAELYGFGAGSGCGKTEGFKEIIDHVINVHKLPVGIIFLEEPVHKTLKVLAGKKLNKRFHIPGEQWTIDELKEGINDLKGKVYLYNHFGAKDWANIKSKIRYMVVSLGIKDIFLDHLTALVAQEENEYKALNRIMEEMASLTQELDCSIFYISHLRKPNGTPHEEGGHVSADQFKGSGAIVYWSNFLFGYERNQQAEDPNTRNTTKFRVLKDRNTGLATGLTFDLWYDHETGRWKEKTEEDGIEDIL